MREDPNAGNVGVPVPIATLLALLDQGDHAVAWLALNDAAQQVSHSPRRKELVSEALIRAFSDNAAALRRADPDRPLADWLSGMLTNLVRERGRATSGSQVLRF